MTLITSDITNIWHEVVCPNCSVAAEGGYEVSDAITGAIKANFIAHKGDAFCSQSCIEQWKDWNA